LLYLVSERCWGTNRISVLNLSLTFCVVSFLAATSVWAEEPVDLDMVNKIRDEGGQVGIGAHGQLQGLGYHWELWSVASGGSNFNALRSATLMGTSATARISNM